MKARYIFLSKKSDAFVGGDKSQKMTKEERAEHAKLTDINYGSRSTDGKVKPPKKEGLLSGVKKILMSWRKGKRTKQKSMTPNEYKKHLKMLQDTGQGKPMFPKKKS